MSADARIDADLLRRAAALMREPAAAQPTAALVDVVHTDGTHDYWSTHCRHDRHDACQATELAPGVPRRPAQCKTCAAPCRCACHRQPAGQGEGSTHA